MAALRIEGVAKSFPAVGGAPPKAVIEHLSFVIKDKERVAVIGPSGCGKSTLLSMVAGLEPVDRGLIERPSDQLLSFVFQEPRLLPWRSVADNLRLVLPEMTGFDDQIEKWINAVGLEDAKEVFASRLSLGMARRTAIARAFIVKPQLLIMDEPFVSLDAATSLMLQSLLLDLLEQEQTALLFVTHDLREAIRVCDRLIFLGPAPSRTLFECAIPLDQAARQQEREIEDMREVIIRDFGVDAGQLAVAGKT